MVLSMPLLDYHDEDSAKIEETIRASIRAVMTVRNINVEDLAQASGVSRSVLYGKLSAEGVTRGFLAREVLAIASALDVPPGDLFKELTIGLVAAS